MPYVKVNDISLYYELQDEGDGGAEGEPLVLIMGLGTDISEWDGVIRWLAKKYRLLAFDNRGAGRSDKPDIPYSIEMMADGHRKADAGAWNRAGEHSGCFDGRADRAGIGAAVSDERQKACSGLNVCENYQELAAELLQSVIRFAYLQEQVSSAALRIHATTRGVLHIRLYRQITRFRCSDAHSAWEER
jgi:hypothetical protein